MNLNPFKDLCNSYLATISGKLQIMLEKFFRLELKPVQLFGVLFILYIIKSTIFVLQNQYLNGDVAIGLLIVDDLKNLQFESWYFYGQYYYGILYYILVAFFTFPFSIGFGASVFVEGFFFLLSLYFLNRFFEKNYLVPTIFFNLFLYWSLPSDYMLPLFQGYSFILLTFIGGAYILYKQYHITRRIHCAIAFGLLSGLMFWVNISFIAIIGAYVLNIFIEYKNNIKKLISTIAIMISGFAIGIVPFLLGIYYTNGLALEWFIGNISGSDSSKIKQIIVSFIDYMSYFLFWLDMPNRFFITDITGDNVSLILRFDFILSAFFGIVLLIYAFKNITEKRVFLSVFLIMGILLFLNVYKGGTRIDPGIRYMNSIFVLVSMLSFRAISIHFEKLKNTLSHKIMISLAAFCISTGILFTFSSIGNNILFAYHGRNNVPIYKLMVSDLIEVDAKYVHCYNFYIYCAQVAYLGRDHGIVVEIIDPLAFLNGRNPTAYNQVFEAQQQNITVYTIAPMTDSIPESSILNEYMWSIDKHVMYQGDITMSGLTYKLIKNTEIY